MSLYKFTAEDVSGKEIVVNVSKFDDDLNVESTHQITMKRNRMYCTCPRGERFSTCRHRKMLPIFIEKGRVNTGWFYDFENEKWKKPLKG
jgi:hypothetical protein